MASQLKTLVEYFTLYLEKDYHKMSCSIQYLICINAVKVYLVIS